MSFKNTDIVSHVQKVLAELGIPKVDALITLYSALAAAGYVGDCEKIDLAIPEDIWKDLVQTHSGFQVFHGTERVCLEYRGVRIYSAYGPGRVATKPPGLQIAGVEEAVSDQIYYYACGYYYPSDEEREVGTRFAKSPAYSEAIHKSVTRGMIFMEDIYRRFMKESIAADI